MNALEAIQETIRPLINDLNELIHRSLLTGNPLMNKVVEGYLQTKGKQIRPILVILSSRLLGEPSPETVMAAAAVEMLHNASLIHDDVVDDTKLRRGRPTVNAIWDNHIAVLVGDFFVSQALGRAIATGDIRIVGAIANLGKLLSLGEIDQICNARYHNLTEEAYFEVISRKTASLFVACIEMGAFAVGCPSDDPRLAALRGFAELLGRCFQIRDDIFDYFADPDSIGKPTGNDLREGKVTLPLLYALSRTDRPECADMRELCAREELSDADIAALTAYAVDNGGVDYAYRTMQRLRDEGVGALRRAFPDREEALKPFIDIFDFIIARKS